MRVVAVLSGGGAKSLAHVGAWRALEEHDLVPAHVVATSMGAVIGAALAAGLSWRAVASAAQAITRRDVAPIAPLSVVKGMFAHSLFNPDGLRRTIDRLVAARRFDDLKIPLTVTATALDTGELTLFGAGGADVPLHDALYASCALPLYLPSITIDGRRYAEGGLRAVLPLAVARSFPADLYVAVHVGPGFDEEPAPRRTRGIPPLVRAHAESERIMMAAQVEKELQDWPRDGRKLVMVRPVREREATFRVSILAGAISSISTNSSPPNPVPNGARSRSSSSCAPPSTTSPAKSMITSASSTRSAASSRGSRRAWSTSTARSTAGTSCGAGGKVKRKSDTGMRWKQGSQAGNRSLRS